MLGTVGRHVSPPPGAQSPVRWGDESVVAELLGDRVTDVDVDDRRRAGAVRERGGVRRPLPDVLRTDLQRVNRLDDEGKAALRADLIELGTASARGGDTDSLFLEWEYRIVTATRA